MLHIKETEAWETKTVRQIIKIISAFGRTIIKKRKVSKSFSSHQPIFLSLEFFSGSYSKNESKKSYHFPQGQ